jgi:DNA-binding NarL/FixJ family response regulator
MKKQTSETLGLFTKSEIDTIRLICRQFTNREIAERTGKGLRTVDGYRESILGKMKVRNTAGIVVFAIRNGIYKP